MNKQGVNKFFKFCRERHSIFLRREAGLPREEWTKDPILQKFKFTNVYRELDRTTAWFKRHVRDKLKDKSEVLLATVLFRMFNRIETGEALFCLPIKNGLTAFETYLSDGDLYLLRRAIRAHVGKTGPYVTGAYIISSPPGFKKLDGMLHVVDQFNKYRCERATCGYQDWQCVARRLIDEPGKHSMQGVWNWLRQFDYLGNFHSYEIVCDLRYTDLLRRAPDIDLWCSPGPGARRGMNRILGRDKDERIPVGDLVELIRTLLHVNAWSHEWWPQPNGESRLGYGDYQVYAHDKRLFQEQWPRWEMREVEHSLCEFDKYERVRKGEGRPRGVYR